MTSQRPLNLHNPCFGPRFRRLLPSSVFVLPMQEVVHWPHSIMSSAASNTNCPDPFQWRLKLWQFRLLPRSFVSEWDKLSRMKQNAGKLSMNVSMAFLRRGRRNANFNPIRPHIMARSTDRYSFARISWNLDLEALMHTCNLLAVTTWLWESSLARLRLIQMPTTISLTEHHVSWSVLWVSSVVHSSLHLLMWFCLGPMLFICGGSHHYHEPFAIAHIIISAGVVQFRD